MNLETENSINGKATEELIRRAVYENDKRGGFLILSSSEQHFLQAAGDQPPFHVEYRKGNDANHMTSEHSFTAKELETILLAYWRQEPKWNEKYQWVETFASAEKPWWKFW